MNLDPDGKTLEERGPITFDRMLSTLRVPAVPGPELSRYGARPARPLKGEKSPAPCWWCSRRLHGSRGVLATVDGNGVIFHGACLRIAEKDPDIGHRIRRRDGQA